MFINSVSYFLIIVVSLVESHSQSCSKGLIVIQRTRTSSITKIKPQEIQTCCDGYQQENLYSLTICKPICKPNCTNGFCVSPNMCLCFSGYKLVNGTCQPTCRYQCGNGTCKSDFCYCFPGFQINYLRYLGHEDGPVCEPICKDCAIKQKLSRSSKNAITSANNPLTAMRTSNSHGYHTEDTTTTTRHPYLTMTTDNNYKYHTTDTTTTTKDPHIRMTTYSNYKYHTTDKTTTTKDPQIRMISYNNYKYHTEDTTTTTKHPHITMTTYNNYKHQTEATTTSTTTTPNFVINNSNSSSAETALDNDANNNVTSTEMLQKSWMEQHGMYVWIPLILILSTALILILVWQGVPMVIINFYKGVRNRKSYNVKGAFRKQSSSGAFDSSCLEFLPDDRGVRPQS